MSLGKQKNYTQQMFIAYDKLPHSPGHAFYEKVQSILKQENFDTYVENICSSYYDERNGRPSIPTGVYFRMHFVAYFERIDSERRLCWKCADSLSLREFLQLSIKQRVPDHSSLSRIRSRFAVETHEIVFNSILKLLAKNKLIKGKKLAIDSSTMEANASMRSIVRRDTEESYRDMLKRMAKESGIETPTAEELVRFDRKRKGKSLSNKDWKSKTDEDAKIAKLKDGRTRLAYKPEHVVDLDSGAIIAAPIHTADKADVNTLHDSSKKAVETLKIVLENKAPKQGKPADFVTDKGYFSRANLKNICVELRSRICEPQVNGRLKWKGDVEARKAVYNNRARLHNDKGKALRKKRTELVERSFAHCLSSGGMRRVHLRGRENIQKRYLLHVAAFNIGILMRSKFGFGTPKQWAEAPFIVLVAFNTESIVIIFVYFVIGSVV
jgi:transposase